MITLVDIKKSINQVLKANFKDTKLYAGEVKEGFTRPSFFTSIIPISFNYDTTNFTSNKLMVVINYFSENETELENIKMYDELKKAFGMNLKVNDRFFLLKNIRSEIVDEVLQFRFDLDYYVDIEKIDNYEIMKELKMRGEI